MRQSRKAGAGKISAAIVAEIFSKAIKRGAQPDATKCGQVAQWLNNAAPVPEAERIVFPGRPRDRGLKAARELRQALDDMLAPGTLMQDGSKVVYTWGDGTVLNPGDERFRPLADALSAAWPLLENAWGGSAGRGSREAARINNLFDCYVWATGRGSASKDGPAVRFVQAALEAMGVGTFEVGAIEQVLRRTAPARAGYRRSAPV